MKNYQFITIIVLILLGIWSTHYILSKMPEKLTANMLAIEYDKVWGMENYVKLNQINKQQVISWLKQFEAQNWKVNISNNVVNNNLNKKVNKNIVSKDKVNSILNSVFTLWDKNSDIVWLEYSDLECPYCKKLHESWVIDKILKDYNWKVSFVFKQFPLTRIHPQSLVKAELALCVWQLWSEQKYYDFIKEVYKKSWTNVNLLKITSDLGIDNEKIKKCIESKKNFSLVNLQEQEWNSNFWIKGTPWNVLLNKKTWEWVLLPWAYSYPDFKKAIDSLLKNN